MKKSLLAILLILCAAAVFLTNTPGCNSNSAGSNDTVSGDNPPPPKSIGYSILATYPHDTSSFTQGLTFYKGSMYEGTGELEKSKLMEVELATGKAKRSVALGNQYFGEGIAILRDTVYQLTWRNKVVFVYTLKDFKKVREFQIDTEGWGITTDGNELIVSDGTSNLYFYNPSDFQLIRKVAITEGGSLAFNLNELEYINGYVYANQWQAAYILKIDPVTGLIDAKADLNEVWNRVKSRDPHADVPNGIAYDSTSKKIYVTGKLWPELYEIQFSN